MQYVAICYRLAFTNHQARECHLTSLTLREGRMFDYRLVLKVMALAFAAVLMASLLGGGVVWTFSP